MIALRAQGRSLRAIAAEMQMRATRSATRASRALYGQAGLRSEPPHADLTSSSRFGCSSPETKDDPDPSCDEHAMV
jgi:hypothetical protein